mgnify:FL=1
MITLYHLPLSAESRIARLILLEKNISFSLQVELTWERRNEFLALNPACTVPVAVDENNNIFVGVYVLAEYLEDISDKMLLIGEDPLERSEVRRLSEWFRINFYNEVGKNIIYEKIFKKLEGKGGPSPSSLRAGRTNIKSHLSYIEWLVGRRDWLAGRYISLADLTAAAYLSCIDYLNEVPWKDYPLAREWYARMKSRPSFRPLLNDFLPGVPPPLHYTDLDF